MHATRDKCLHTACLPGETFSLSQNEMWIRGSLVLGCFMHSFLSSPFTHRFRINPTSEAAREEEEDKS
jgi:hypothetical protein